MNEPSHQRQRIGPWLVIQKLGGTGSVQSLLVQHEREQALRVALRVVRLEEPGGAAVWTRAVEVLRRLKHPALPELLDRPEAVGTDAGLGWIATWHTPGPTLAERLRAGPLAPASCSEAFLRIVDAVRHAHAHEVAHRTLSPSCLILSDEGACVTGFEEALILDHTRLTSDDTIPGAIRYLPPEAFHDTAEPQQTDIYAIGVLLYEALSGRRAFVDEAGQLLKFGPLLEAKQRGIVLEREHGFTDGVCWAVGELTSASPQRRLDGWARLTEVLETLASPASGVVETAFVTLRAVAGSQESRLPPDLQGLDTTGTRWHNLRSPEKHPPPPPQPTRPPDEPSPPARERRPPPQSRLAPVPPPTKPLHRGQRRSRRLMWIAAAFVACILLIAMGLVLSYGEPETAGVVTSPTNGYWEPIVRPIVSPMKAKEGEPSDVSPVRRPAQAALPVPPDLPVLKVDVIGSAIPPNAPQVEPSGLSGQTPSTAEHAVSP